MCVSSDMATVDCESLICSLSGALIGGALSLSFHLFLSSCLYFFWRADDFLPAAPAGEFWGCVRPVCFHPTKYICRRRHCCCCGSSPRVRANDYSARWKISVIISARERASRENFFYCVLGCALPKQRAERYKIFRLFLSDEKNLLSDTKKYCRKSLLYTWDRLTDFGQALWSFEGGWKIWI
jgi:hypothetical protein